MRVHEVAVLVHRADAVSVAVVDEACVIAELFHLRQATVDPRLDRLRVQTVERGVFVVVDFADLYAHVAQDACQVMTARTVKRVDHHAQACLADGLDVHALLQGIQVRGNQVHDLVVSARFGSIRQQGGLHAVRELSRRSPAVDHAQLHAQVFRRVMTAREHDAAHGVFVLRHRPAQARRGAVVVGQLHAEAVRSGNLRGQLCVTMRILAAVMADDERVFARKLRPCIAVFLENARRRVDGTSERFVREVFTDDGAPAVGAEMDVSHEVAFLKPRTDRAARRFVT